MNEQIQELNEQLESALNGVLLAVEQSVSNGCCDFDTESAFNYYEDIRIKLWKLNKENTLDQAMPNLAESKSKLMNLGKGKL